MTAAYVVNIIFAAQVFTPIAAIIAAIIQRPKSSPPRPTQVVFNGPVFIDYRKERNYKP